MAKSNTRITADKDEVAIYTYEYTATSGQTTFSGSDDNSATLDYTAGSITVSYGGLELPESDYTATNGTSVVLADGAVAGEIIRVVAYEPFVVSDALPITGGTLTGGLNVSSGNVGIGTGSPTAILDVRRGDASGKIAEFHTNTGYGVEIGSSQSEAYIQSGHLQALVLGSHNTERMRIDSSGIVTKPNHPAFDVAYSGTAYTTLGTVAFDTVYSNVGGHYSTSNGRFTAPVSGSYIFYTSYIKNSSTNVCRRRFDKNGLFASNGRHLRLDAGQSYGDNGVLQSIIYLNAGDYVQVNQYAGGSYGTLEYDYFGGYLIG